MTARLKRLKLLGNIEAELGRATADLCGVALARLVASSGGDGEVADDNTAVALAAKLCSGEGVAGVLASIQTLLSSQGGGLERHAPRQSLAFPGVIRVAAEGNVVVDLNLLMGEESRVLEDGEVVVAAADLSLVAIARQIALAILNLRPVDSRTTSTAAVVLDSGIAVTVTLALSHTLLLCHGLGVQAAAVDKGVGVLETASRHEGAELLNAGRELDIPGASALDERDSRESGRQSPERRHDVGEENDRGS